MKIVFRTDSSIHIGSGHVMRCLTLADELRQRGADVLFICREHDGHLIEYIEGKNYSVIHLQAKDSAYIERPNDVTHAPWLGVFWEQDAQDTIAAVGDTHPQWLIIDNYAIDRRWEEKLRPYIGKIMVIDDLADRPHDCELLLDQNLYPSMETRYDGLVSVDCVKLLGPKYALLRPEFTSARKNLCQRDGNIRRILVFFGGVDPTNETIKALRALLEITDFQFEVDIVVGRGNPNKKQIQDNCSVTDRFRYHCQVENMAELMASADLAIGAGGSTTWERCALGLPTLLVTLAANQFNLASYGAETGIFFLLGNTRSVSSSVIENVVRSFLIAPQNLLPYSRKCLEVVDARGLQRVITTLMPLMIDMRPAEFDDCDSIYEWRNSEETRKYIFDPEPITLEDHRIWFHNSMNNSRRIILIGEIDSKPVGVVRYDLSGNCSLISVYLVPGRQSQGVGTELIRSGTRWLRRNRPLIRIINAEILFVNIASKRAFELAGYNEHHVTYQEVLS